MFIETYHQMPDLQSLNVQPTTGPHNLQYSIVDNEEFVGCYINFLANEATHLDNSELLLAHSTHPYVPHGLTTITHTGN